MKKFFDFSFYKMNYLPVVILILTAIWVKTFNISEILENSVYENIAIIPLIAAIILCFKAKNHKVFFRFVALVLLLIIGREFNYGRVPFCAIEGTNAHEFYPWSHYKYGFLAHIFIGAYIAIIALYALVNKIWTDLIEIINKAPIPVWTALGVFICIFFQFFSEHRFENTIVEEAAEFTIYCCVFVFAWIYYQKTGK